MSLPVPDYVEKWWGKQITWKDGDRLLSGRVLEVTQKTEYDHLVIRLRVARDDGFVAVGVRANDVLRCE